VLPELSLSDHEHILFNLVGEQQKVNYRNASLLDGPSIRRHCKASSVKFCVTMVLKRTLEKMNSSCNRPLSLPKRITVNYGQQGVKRRFLTGAHS
jgi:hypothetical protein